MIAKRAAEPTPLPADWTVALSMTIHGRHVAPGTELSVDGIRGRVTFVRHVTRPAVEWVDVIAASSSGFRSVRPAAIRTVHTKRKARP